MFFARAQSHGAQVLELGLDVLAEFGFFDPESLLPEEVDELPEELDPESELPDEPDDEFASELELEPESEDDELDAFSDSLAFERDLDRDESLLSVL